MPMELKYKVKKEYLWVEFSGKRTPGKEVEEAIDIWKKVADLCEKNNLKRIMVISKVEGRLPALSFL